MWSLLGHKGSPPLSKKRNLYKMPTSYKRSHKSGSRKSRKGRRKPIPASAMALGEAPFKRKSNPWNLHHKKHWGSARKRMLAGSAPRRYKRTYEKSMSARAKNQATLMELNAGRHYKKKTPRKKVGPVKGHTSFIAFARSTAQMNKHPMKGDESPWDYNKRLVKASRKDWYEMKGEPMPPVIKRRRSGKRRSHKRRSHKSKSHKSRSHKSKSRKSKSHKSKSHKTHRYHLRPRKAASYKSGNVANLTSPFAVPTSAALDASYDVSAKSRKLPQRGRKHHRKSKSKRSRKSKSRSRHSKSKRSRKSKSKKSRKSKSKKSRKSKSKKSRKSKSKRSRKSKSKKSRKSKSKKSRKSKSKKSKSKKNESTGDKIKNFFEHPIESMSSSASYRHKKHRHKRRDAAYNAAQSVSNRRRRRAAVYDAAANVAQTASTRHRRRRKATSYNVSSRHRRRRSAKAYNVAQTASTRHRRRRRAAVYDAASNVAQTASTRHRRRRKATAYNVAQTASSRHRRRRRAAVYDAAANVAQTASSRHRRRRRATSYDAAANVAQTASTRHRRRRKAAAYNVAQTASNKSHRRRRRATAYTASNRHRRATGAMKTAAPYSGSASTLSLSNLLKFY